MPALVPDELEHVGRSKNRGLVINFCSFGYEDTAYFENMLTQQFSSQHKTINKFTKAYCLLNFNGHRGKILKRYHEVLQSVSL